MGAKCLLLWTATAAAGGGLTTAPGAAGAPHAARPPPPDAYEVACAAAARATGGPPTGTWGARIQLLRATPTGPGGRTVDAVAVSSSSAPADPAAAPSPPPGRGPPPPPSLPPSCPSTPTTHVVLPASRRVMAGGPGLVPLLLRAGGFEKRGGPLEVGGLEFGSAAGSVIRVGRLTSGGAAAAGGTLRAVVLEVELADADDLAEAAPALAELSGRLRTAVGCGGGGGATGGGVALAPVPAPVSEYGLDRVWGGAHGAVQLAGLAGAVLGGGKGEGGGGGGA